MKLLVKSGPEDAFPEWKRHFGDLYPDLEVHFWSDPSVAPEDVDAVMVWEPPAGWLASLPNLKLVISSGAGVDHITADPDWPRHLPLVRMGGTEQRMNEFVVWAALSLLRDTRDFTEGQSRREWRYKEVPFCARDLCVGIMGLGNLGKAANEALRAIGFRTRGWSRTQKRIDGLDTFAGTEELAAFLSGSDILLDLLPATAETTNMIDAAFLSGLPKGAGFINAGRGAHVVEADLIALLDSGHLSAALLDVFQCEPLPEDSPIWDHPKITVTPHIASTPTKRDKVVYISDVLRRFVGGAPLPNVYQAERGY